MQKLTLSRRLTGLHTVHGPDGQELGTVDLNDIDLNDSEFEELVKQYAERKRAAAAADELIKQARDYAARAGSIHEKPSALNASEKGTPSNGVSARLAEAARARADLKKVPYSVALSEITREHPELGQAARLEVMGVRKV